jgi:CSLREA domain-containing protein
MPPRQPIVRFCLVLITVMALLGSSQQAVHSAPSSNLAFTVNSFQDLDDSVSNSVCSVGHETNGPCTLRAAVTEANANIVTPNQNIIIKLPAGEYDLTLPPVYSLQDFNGNRSGDLNIEPFSTFNMYSITVEPLNIGKVVIKSMIYDRILSVGTDAKVFIKNITMQNGQVLIDPLVDSRGGGAIYNEGNLYLSGGSLLNNKVKCSSTASCTNEVTGGAVFNIGTLSLTDSTLDGNEAERGSAIFNTGEQPAGTLNIQYSTISNNVNWGAETIINYSKTTIFNSTFSGNSSGKGEGYPSGIENNGTLHMQSSTMANKGSNGGIVNGKSLPLYTGIEGVADNIFKAENGFANCYISAGTVWTSGGYNIASDASCQLKEIGDLENSDPLLANFGSWGGPTKTFALLGNSPAINDRNDICQLPVIQIFDDQKHWPRSDGKCDTGAVEYLPYWLYLPLISK